MTVSNHPNEDDRFEQIWERACAPDSPLVKGVKELRKLSCVPLPSAESKADFSAETDTFISRHAAAMDICQHPSVRIISYLTEID
jgi:beta-1,2-xylosyltransferase